MVAILEEGVFQKPLNMHKIFVERPEMIAEWLKYGKMYFNILVTIVVNREFKAKTTPSVKTTPQSKNWLKGWL